MKSGVCLPFAPILPILGLAACIASPPSQQSAQPSRACAPPRSHWESPHNFSGLLPAIIIISIDRDGKISWEDQRVTLAQAANYLRFVHILRPKPIVFLQTEMGASCATIEAVRDIMDRELVCRNYGGCAEGIFDVWSNMPTPPGTPPS